MKALAISILLILTSSFVHAVPMMYSYDYTLDNFLDSNLQPPPSVSGPISGTVSLTLDLDLIIGETGYVDAFTPFQNDDGVEFNTSNTIFGKTTHSLTPDKIFRIAVGGIGLSSTPSIPEAGGLVGLSDDFRFIFFIDGMGDVDQSLTATLLPDNSRGYTNGNGGAYLPYIFNISRSSASNPSETPVPGPANFALFALGLAGLYRLKRKSSP